MADFTQRYHQQRWDVRFVGTLDTAAAAAGGQGGQGGRSSSEDAYGRINVAEAVITEDNNLLFEGGWGGRWGGRWAWGVQTGGFALLGWGAAFAGVTERSCRPTPAGVRGGRS